MKQQMVSQIQGMVKYESFTQMLDRHIIFVEMEKVSGRFPHCLSKTSMMESSIQ